MISIIFASRIKNNPDSNLNNFLYSLKETCSRDELAKLEVIIKYDDDDDLRPSNDYLTQHGIKYVVYDRCTGRSMLHHFCEYLFTLRNKDSGFVLQAADDFRFTRPGWVSDILSHKKKYLFLGCGQCDKEPGPWHTKPRPPIEHINYNNMMSWRCIFGNVCPIFSTSLIETTQNFGWTSSIDAWAYLLAMMCYHDFKINIFDYMPAFYERTEGFGVAGEKHDETFKKGFDYSYNQMQQTGSKNCQNLYWFDLVRQQAKNIYLNIKEDGLLEEYAI